MELLKKYWPLGFKAKKGDVVSLIVWLVIGIIFCAVIGWVIGLIDSLPVINIFGGIIGLLMEIYGIVNIVLCVLSFLGKV